MALFAAHRIWPGAMGRLSAMLSALLALSAACAHASLYTGKAAPWFTQGTVRAIVDTVLYTGADLVDSIAYGNGIGERRTYEVSRPLLTSIRASRNGHKVFAMGNTYDNEGNIIGQDRAGGEWAQYSLDGLYRLTGVRYPSGVQRTTPNLEYTYDNNGNRLQFTHEFGSARWSYRPGTNLLDTGSLDGTGYEKYGFDYRGNLSQTERYSTRAGLIAGNQWLERGRYQYNKRNELERVLQERRRVDGVIDLDQWAYVYDETGNRIAKRHAFGVQGSDTSWITTRRYLYDGVSVLADSSADDSSWTYHVDLGLRPVAEISKSGSAWKAKYFLTDHLGTVNAIADDTGAVRGRYENDAYGNLEDYQGDLQTDWVYTGKERDPETGWIYFNARYYDPVRGMWNARDKAGQFWSPYGYAGIKNPVICSDSSGQFLNYAIGFAVGAGLEYTTQLTSNYLYYGNLERAFFEVDATDVLVSGTAGATGAGLLEKTRKLGMVGRVAANFTEGAVSSVAKDVANKKNVDVKNAAIEGITGAGIGELGQIVGNKLAKDAVIEADKAVVSPLKHVTVEKAQKAAIMVEGISAGTVAGTQTMVDIFEFSWDQHKVQP